MSIANYANKWKFNWQRWPVSWHLLGIWLCSEFRKWFTLGQNGATNWIRASAVVSRLFNPIYREQRHLAMEIEEKNGRKDEPLFFFYCETGVLDIMATRRGFLCVWLLPSSALKQKPLRSRDFLFSRSPNVSCFCSVESRLWIGFRRVMEAKKWSEALGTAQRIRCTDKRRKWVRRLTKFGHWVEKMLWISFLTFKFFKKGNFVNVWSARHLLNLFCNSLPFYFMINLMIL